MARFALVRHGETPSNIDHLLDTAHPGADLTELGRTQAQEAGRDLSERGYTRIYSSHIARAIQTAQHTGIDYHGQLPGLEEIRAGELEMRGDDDALRIYQGAFNSWVCDATPAAFDRAYTDFDHAILVPGGESYATFIDRFYPTITQLLDSGLDNFAIVSHGAAIRTFVANACDVDRQLVANSIYPNCGIVEITTDGPIGTWPANLPTLTPR